MDEIKTLNSSWMLVKLDHKSTNVCLIQRHDKATTTATVTVLSIRTGQQIRSPNMEQPLCILDAFQFVSFFA
jgi:hypothetical protein